MANAWRPLGELLIERGLLDEYELEYWLKEQTLSGMLLGELLVLNRVVAAAEVAATLAIQRGVGDVAEGIRSGPRQLGRRLVDKELLTESGLQRALLAQRRHGGSLGDILVQRGYVSQQQVDDVLAEQRRGEEPEPPPVEPPSQAAPDRYEVRSPDPGGAALFVSGAFLDATDFAFDLIESDDPDEIAIVRVAADDTSEPVWSYTRAESERFRAETASQREPSTVDGDS